MTVLGGVSNRVSFAHYSQKASVLLRLCWQRHCLAACLRSIHGSNIHRIESLMKSKSLSLPVHRFTRVLFITSKTFDPVLITDKTLKKKWLKQDSQALTLRRRQLRLRRLRPTFVSIRPTSALFLAYSKSLHWSVPIHHCLYLSNKLLISHHSSSF